MSSPSTRASSKFKSRPSGSSFKRKRGVFESAFQRFGDDANDMQMQSMISNNVKINGGTSNWMLRPMKLPCKFALRKCNCRKKRTAYVDHIGQLPDELLVFILSHLTVKEAVRTSVLSKRWKELWKFITRLNFDDTKMYQDAMLDWDLVETGRQRYAGYVHEVLNSHQAGCIEDFRVGSDLATSFWGQIDEWINFALRKRVNRLEVDLRCFCSVEYDHSSDYHSEHNYKITMEKFTIWSFKSLASFVLYKVDVTGCMLESLLSNCPLLERLSIANSKDLVKFKIVGPSIFRLKYLEIRNCSGVKEIEISAAELISFVYSGPNIKFPFRNSTFPIEASVGGLFGKFLVHDTSEELFSCYFSQVTRLTLDFENQISLFFPSFPELPKVKELELRVVGWSLYNFRTFIIPAESCPSLVKFTFTLYDTWLPLRTKNYTPGYFGRRGLKNLQVLELKGFVGTASEIAMIRFLFRNSVKLRKTTIDPFAPYMKRDPLELIGEGINLRRGRAKRLSTEFPAKVQVVIL